MIILFSKVAIDMVKYFFQIIFCVIVRNISIHAMLVTIGIS